MICPECELEVDYLNNKGTCKQCAVRRNQVTYLNKKNGTNEPYIPLKDLKNTNPSAYRKVMARRLGQNWESKINKKPDYEINKVTSKDSDKSLKNIYYSRIYKEVEEEFKKSNLSQDYIKYNIYEWFSTFWELLQENNFILEARQGERIFNNITNKHRHLQESLDWDDIDQINDENYLLKALSEIRRPTKELLDFYEPIEQVVETIKADKKLMKIIEDTRIVLFRKLDNHENKGYMIEPITNRNKVYDCTVWCTNLNGNPNRQLFRANGGISAKSPKEAELKFKAFLSDKFASVRIEERTITIKEMTPNKEYL